MPLTPRSAQFGVVTGLNPPLYVEFGPAATLSAVGRSAGATLGPAAAIGDGDTGVCGMRCGRGVPID